MEPTLLGVKNEYGFAVLGLHSRLQRREVLLAAMMEVARAALCCLPAAQGSGVFLENGARLYPEVGAHAEYSTPECPDPWQAVRHVLAGDQILASLASDVERIRGVRKITLWRSNVDYLTGATWGAHENYLYCCSRESMHRILLAHLISRICYSGAGGFRPAAAGLEFLLSPRVAYLAHCDTAGIMAARPLVQDKADSLGRGHKRLHLVCGESLCSELAYVLKLGTTALIVAAIDAGALDAPLMCPIQPIPSMWRIAKDPYMRTTVPLACGRSMTAIEIQRWYLERIAAHLGKRWMPSWAPRLCEYWEDTLQRLSEGPEAVSTRLDWAAKLMLLFRPHLERRGLDERSVGVFSTAARMRDPGAASAALELDDDDDNFDMTDDDLESIRMATSRTQRSSRQIRSYLESRGLDEGGLTRFEHVRHEIFEIDAIFTEITGKRGIFAALDTAGMLEHRVAEVGDPERAMFEPPSGGRAAQRAAYIRKLHKVGGSSCSWDYVYDGERRVAVDLSDPFGRKAFELPRGATRAGIRSRLFR